MRNLQLVLGSVEIAHADLSEIARVILVQVGAVMMLEKKKGERRTTAEAQAVNGVLDLQQDLYHQDVYDASQCVRGLRKRGHGAF